jgi:hypothetical protein
VIWIGFVMFLQLPYDKMGTVMLLILIGTVLSMLIPMLSHSQGAKRYLFGNAVMFGTVLVGSWFLLGFNIEKLLGLMLVILIAIVIGEVVSRLVIGGI